MTVLHRWRNRRRLLRRARDLECLADMLERGWGLTREGRWVWAALLLLGAATDVFLETRLRPMERMADRLRRRARELRKLAGG